MDTNETNTILFMDIDGVLTSPLNHLIHSVINGDKRGLMMQFDQNAIAALNNTWHKKKYQFVISSTWRIGHSEGDMHNMFKVSGLLPSIHEDWRTIRSSHGKRGIEIQHWLDTHPECKDFLIIDDEWSDIPEPHLRERFAKCDVENGITLEAVDRLYDWTKE